MIGKQGKGLRIEGETPSTTATAREIAAAREAALREQWIRDFADLVITGASDRLDLGDLVATGLALAAAELGGIDEITAGHPGTWQGESLLRLARGKVGPNRLAAVHSISVGPTDDRPAS